MTSEYVGIFIVSRLLWQGIFFFFCGLIPGIDPKLVAFRDKQGGTKDLHFTTRVPNVERIDDIHLITYVVWFRVPVEVEVMRCFLWELLEMTDIWKWIMTLNAILAFSSISIFCSFAPEKELILLTLKIAFRS